MDDESLMTDGVQPDAPGDLQTLEQMIAADEAADAGKSEIVTRDESGRFTKQGASAKEAPRAGERLTPEEIKATPATSQNGKADQGQASQNGKPKDSSDQPKTEAQQDNNQTAADPDAGKSKYGREVARRERSWADLNKQKEEFAQQKAEFELREQTVAAREQALASGRGGPARAGGFTAEQYEAAAPKFKAKALEYEQQGEFEKADEQRQLAENATAAAAELRKQSGGVNGGIGDGWKKLKADLPEALNVNSPLNQTLRELIKQRPELLGDEQGPYRAAVLAGRKLVAGLETKLNGAQAEAAKVPGLLEQVQTLTARVRELEGLTSLGGGGGTVRRGAGGEKSFHSMSTAEQEAAIERELASAL